VVDPGGLEQREAVIVMQGLDADAAQFCKLTDLDHFVFFLPNNRVVV
jgi:hypothetical protein